MNTLAELGLNALIFAVNSIAIAAALTVTVAVAFRFTQGINPRLRYCATVIAFIGALILPALTTFEIFPTRGATFSVQTASPDAQMSDTVSFEAREVSPVVSVPITAATLTSREPTLSNYYFEATPQVLLTFLALWAVGTLLLLGREIAGHLLLMKARRSWPRADENFSRRLEIPANVQVYVCEGEGPFAVGVVKPAIVLPSRLLTDLPVAAARQIVRHEMDHVFWHDPTVNAALRLLRAIFWVVFPIWILERMTRLEREAAADRAAVKPDDLGVDSAKEYANAMVAMIKWSAAAAKARRFRFITTGISAQPGLEKRVRRLFHTAPLRVTRLSFAILVTCAGIGSVFFIPAMTSATGSSGSGLVIAVANNAVPVDTIIFPEVARSASARRAGTAIAAESLQNVETVMPKDGDQASTNLNAVMAAATAEQDMPANRTDDQLAAIKKFAVTPEFISEMAATGYPGLSIDRLIDLRRFGVNAAFVSEMAGAGYANLSIALLLDFRRHGVSPTYIQEMRQYGYHDLSAQTILAFRQQAVSVSFIREVAELGYGGLSAQTILEFRQQPVSARFITDISDVVNAPPTARELINLRKFAVTTEFIAELKRLDYDEVTAGELLLLKQTGVTTAFVREMNTRDATNHSLRELVAMRVNGAH